MDQGYTALGILLLVAIVALIGAHSVSLALRKRFQLLDPLFAFWGGVLVIYVGQPIFYGATLIQWHSPAIYEETLFWTLFAILFVILGYERRAGVQLGNRLPRMPERLVPRKLTLAGYVLIGLSLVGYYILFDSAGGLQQWLAVGRGGTDFTNLSGYVTQCAELLPVGVILLLFQIQVERVSMRRAILVWGATALVWWWFLYIGSRSRLIGFSIQVLAAYYLPRQKSPPLLLAGLAYLALFVLSNFQAYYRGNFTNLSLNLNQIEMSEAKRRVLPGILGGESMAQSDEIGRGAEFDCAMSVVELVPHGVPFNYGYGHLELFTRWIPRSLWRDKAYPHMESVQGVLRKARLSLVTVPGTQLLAGPAFGFVGHWYYVAGPIGLLLGGLLTGILMRVIRTIYDRGKTSLAELMVYATLIYLGFNEAAATPLIWVFTLPFSLGPLILMLILCRHKRAAW